MTRNSHPWLGEARPDEITRIAEDLRRQRQELARWQETSDASAAETAQLVGKIETLRRRMEGLTTRDDENRR